MITASFPIAGGDFDSAGIATRLLKEHLARVGVEPQAMRRAMIASYEAEMNVVIHARVGTLWARLDEEKLDLEVSDEGPGIPDVELAMREGWSTAPSRAREMGFGAGMGLPNIRRNSDLFDIETRVGRGTRIRSTIFLRQGEETSRGAPAAVRMIEPDGSRCRACMRCIFACPTGALRIRQDGPVVRDELCIGCTACIAECARGVYRIAGAAGAAAGSAVAPGAVLIAPRGFLSGLPVPDSPRRVRAALRAAGCAHVRLLEEWEGALRVAARARAEAAPGGPRPLIPPLCPAVVSLVESRYPSLIPSLGPWLSPAEAASEEFPLQPLVIAAACPAQFLAARAASVTGRLTVLGPAELAERVRPFLSAPAGATETGEPVADASARASSALVVTGSRHVLRALAEAETGALSDVGSLELFLCEAGCAGSALLCAEPWLSQHRWEKSSLSAAGPADPGPASSAAAVARRRPFAQRTGVRLDPDMGRAMRKLALIDETTRSLPGRDCGACGAPSCAACAEDFVMGRAPMACPYVEAGQRKETR